MNDTKYLVYVDDGDNKNIHEVFADSVDQAKLIIVDNGISPDFIVRIEVDPSSIQQPKTQNKTKVKTMLNPITGEQMVIGEEIVEDCKVGSDNKNNSGDIRDNIPTKVFDINGVKIGIINGEPYSLSWSDLEDDSDYRIINKKTDRVTNNPNYKIQKRRWVKMPLN